MALTVNSNISSLNAQRNLVGSQGGLGRSLERLSSGLRINKAGDDAAGLTISDGLKSQIKGLNQAIRNANDGISLMATAEGAIGEITNDLQRLRELAVQASSDTYSGANRASIQSEVDQLVSEITRIGSTVQFNGQKILDGSFTSKNIQIGANKGETLALSIGDVRASKIGAVASTTGTATNQVDSGDVVLNGITVGTATADGVSYASSSTSALADVNAINAVSGQSGVTAEVVDTTRTATGSVVAATLAAGDLVINGVDIGAVTFSNSDSTGTLKNKINAVSNQTGVVASVSSGGVLSLSAADGRNITVTTTAAGNTASLLNAAAGTTTYKGTFKLVSDSTFTVSGTTVGDAGLTAGSYNPDVTKALNSINVTTQANANSAITTIDYAIKQVNSTRANLGGQANRLEAVVTNLSAIAENLSSSQSRILDADFASETAQMTRSQILQQAGTAILAQANSTPQSILSLLK